MFLMQEPLELQAEDYHLAELQLPKSILEHNTKRPEIETV